jgi:hypothetical protein
MRLTRNSYKRKIITLGISAFISLSLVATGFASWVLSATAQKESEGNVSVGTTKEAKIEISDVSFTDGIADFAFEPREDDESGRVQNDKQSFENLSITASCTVKNIASVELISVKFEMPAGVQAAIEQGYITAPAIATAPIEITDCAVYSSGEYWTYTPNIEDNSATITLTVSFGWGAKFGNMNPGIYYDNNEVGKTVEYDEVKKELDTLKAVIYEQDYDTYIALDDGAKDALEAPKYKIVITASA